MTGDVRQALKACIDRRVREKLKWTQKGGYRCSGSRVVCGGCGGESDRWTIGCAVCSNRHKKRGYKALRHGLTPPVVEKVRRCRVCSSVLADRRQPCTACSQSQDSAMERAYRIAERRCVGCDITHDEYTDGCDSCKERRRGRERTRTDQKAEGAAFPLARAATPSDTERVPA